MRESARFPFPGISDEERRLTSGPPDQDLYMEHLTGLKKCYRSLNDDQIGFILVHGEPIEQN